MIITWHLLSFKMVVTSRRMSASAVWGALLGVSGLYACYYLLRVVKKPKVYSNPSSKLAAVLRRDCPILSESYWPTPWAINCHLATILRSSLQRDAPVQYKRELVLLKDGGQIALDWEDISQTSFDQPSAPILLIMPGLTGNSGHNYLTHLVQDGVLQQYRPVVFNQRGCGGVQLKTAMTYSAAGTRDLREVVDLIRGRYPEAPIVGVGVSVGGVILTKYLYDYHDSRVQCAITFCSSFNMVASNNALKHFPSNVLYDKYLGGELKRLALRHAEAFRKDTLDVRTFDKINVIDDFDRLITIKIHGYPSVEDYYRDASNTDRVAHIRTPLIAVNTVDDPFVPTADLPVAKFQSNPQTVLIVPQRGGHFGFIEGFFPFGATWMDRTLRQCLKALRNSKEL